MGDRLWAGWWRAGLLVLAAASLIGGCAVNDRETSSAPTTAGEAITVLDPVGFAELLEDPSVTVVNVHVPYEGELPGTDAFVAYDQILEWDGLPQDTDATIALYCMSGNMSRQAALALVGAGYTDVRELDGGILAWRDSGREVVTRDASAQPQG